MAFVVKDRVKETTTTTGTGTLTLAGASTGYQSFSVIGNANQTFYTISSPGGTEWEVGIGTYTLSGTTLSRDTVLESSNAGAKVNFSAGTKDVYCVYPAEKATYQDDTQMVYAGTSGAIFLGYNAITASLTLPTSNYNGLSVGPITVNAGATVTVPSGTVWTVV
jgi:hypothetical protein